MNSLQQAGDLTPDTATGPTTGAATGGGGTGQTGDAGGRRIPVALAVWGSLIVAACAAGAVLHGLGVLRIDHLPPFHGHFRTPSITLLPPLALAVLAVATLPALTARLRFRQALLVAYGTALAWTVSLAVSGEGLARPFTNPGEYPAVLPAVADDPLGWLDSFVERLHGYPAHVRGHPPLPVLVVWALARAGLPGPFWAALLVVAVGCSATVAVALTVRRLAGEEAARAALPYLALTPTSVWIATSMDAFFAGVGAWGVALLVLGGGAGIAPRAGTLSKAGIAPRAGTLSKAGIAPRARTLPWAGIAPRARTLPRAGGPSRAGIALGSGDPSRAGIVAGAGAGVLLGALPYLSYGLVPYLLIPLVAAFAARIPRGTVFACLAGAAAVTAAFAASGFLWPSGVLATHAEWSVDPGAARPYFYFLVADVAVLALLTGPAAAVGLARTPPGVRALVVAAAVAVLALDLSGVTRGEVERIWVPYAVWIVLAAVAAPGRRWLAAQALTGLLLQGLVISPW
ncbi:hypothetical protein [Streptosporangium carneum]|uniref:Membrane protein n=1 Tax=Streptosporangium carneum TaxID=47481 RepID=A0A9W6MES1_9ACTN|nr:hypothetical protein [Streptosporangium carneum]GLK11113.1 membrane protein [Streptosporangium carneum]